MAYILRVFVFLFFTLSIFSVQAEIRVGDYVYYEAGLPDFFDENNSLFKAQVIRVLNKDRFVVITESGQEKRKRKKELWLGKGCSADGQVCVGDSYIAYDELYSDVYNTQYKYNFGEVIALHPSLIETEGSVRDLPSKKQTIIMHRTVLDYHSGSGVFDESHPNYVAPFFVKGNDMWITDLFGLFKTSGCIESRDICVGDDLAYEGSGRYLGKVSGTALYPTDTSENVTVLGPSFFNGTWYKTNYTQTFDPLDEHASALYHAGLVIPEKEPAEKSPYSIYKINTEQP